MRPHWARGVFVGALEKEITFFRVIVLTKEVVQTLLAQGKRKVWLAVARAGRQRRRAKSWHEERRDNFLNGSIAEQHWAGRVKAQALQKP